MAGIKNLVFDIQEEFEKCTLNFQQIAQKYDVTTHELHIIWQMYIEQLFEEETV